MDISINKDENEKDDVGQELEIDNIINKEISDSVSADFEDVSDEELDYIEDIEDQVGDGYCELSEDSIDTELQDEVETKGGLKIIGSTSSHSNFNDSGSSIPTKLQICQDMLVDFRYKTLLIFPVTLKDLKTLIIREELSKCSTFGTKLTSIMVDDNNVSNEGYLELHYLTWDDAFLSEHLLLSLKPDIKIRRQSTEESHESLTSLVKRDKLNPLRESFDTVGTLLLIGLPQDITCDPSEGEEITTIEQDLLDVLPGSVAVIIPFNDKSLCKGYAYIDYGTREKALEAYENGVKIESPAYLNSDKILFIDVHLHSIDNSNRDIEKLTINQRSVMSAKINQLKRDLKKSAVEDNIKKECEERITILEQRLDTDQKRKIYENVPINTKPQAKRARISGPIIQGSKDNKNIKQEYNKPIDLRESLNKRAFANEVKRGGPSWGKGRGTITGNGSNTGGGFRSGFHNSQRGVFTRGGQASMRGQVSTRGLSARSSGYHGARSRTIVGGTVVPESVSKNQEAMKLINTLSHALSEKVQHEFTGRNSESIRRYEMEDRLRSREADYMNNEIFRDEYSRSRENMYLGPEEEQYFRRGPPQDARSPNYAKYERNEKYRNKFSRGRGYPFRGYRN